VSTRSIARVAVGTTPVQVLAANLYRSALRLRASGSVTVFIGTSSEVTVTTGWQIQHDNPFVDATPSTDSVWAVAIEGTFLEVIEDSSAAPGNAAPVLSQEATYVETGAGQYTGSVTVPAGSTILDIEIRSTNLWGAATSALMDVGDVATPAGWYSQINLKATDLLVGEVIRFGSTGGKEGTYLVTATGAQNASYNAGPVVISGVITSVGAGTTGRTRMLVTYTTPTPVVATKV
jgi:hypothetical protein